ncbi:MutS protein [Dirofilaria immitis]
MIILLFAIIGIHRSIATFSMDTCIDQVSSLIMSICKGCVQIAISSKYTDNSKAMDTTKLLYNVADRCCRKKCFLRFFRSLCCNI